MKFEYIEDTPQAVTQEQIDYLRAWQKGRKYMKPVLDIDLRGPAGNIFVVVSEAQKLLSEEAGKEMWQRVQQTHSYKDALDVINGYVDIVDHSGIYFSSGEE